jgi:deoxyadenosine/deoxycytidine kinase
MDEAEYMIYSTLCDKLIQESPLKAIIYLRCPPEVCLQRIHQRNREGEEHIPL